MDIRTIPVLTNEYQKPVDQLSVGLGEAATCVLAYLVWRYEGPSLERGATGMAAQIGTGGSEHAVKGGFKALTSAGLITETTMEISMVDRTPNAWYATDGPSEAMRRVYKRHASRLFRQADRFDTRFSASPGSDRMGSPGFSEPSDSSSFSNVSESSDPSVEHTNSEGKDAHRVSIALN